MRSHHAFNLTRAVVVTCLVLLAGCATAPHQHTGDPYESFNRSMFTFNQKVDKAVIRPTAVAYKKVTNPPVRRSITDFFDNIRLPVTIGNDLLQAHVGDAAENTGRFLINLTLGFGGFFDPATHFGIPDHRSDFGITLARWGVPDGPFLMLPFIGPTTVRNVWSLPVDSYLFDPLSYYSRNHGYPYGQQYLPQLLYLVNLRANAMSVESFLNEAYDPYTFVREAYRQHRVYLFYNGNPPDNMIDNTQQQNNGPNFDPEKLLQEQREYQKTHGGPTGSHGASSDKTNHKGTAPASATSTSGG